jgi:uncharacterized protein YggE
MPRHRATTAPSPRSFGMHLELDLGFCDRRTLEDPDGLRTWVTKLCDVRFKIVRVEQAPAAAFEAARAAVPALREHGIGAAAVKGSRLDLKTATEYVDLTRKFVGYQCQAAFAVESGALDDVEPLLVDVVAAGANEIEGVEFDVIAKRELRAEIRRKGGDR